MSEETIAQKLRRWVNESERHRSYPTDEACRELYGTRLTAAQERELFECIAYKIEEELTQAKQDSNNAAQNGVKKTLENVTGKPFKEGETVPQWFDRWFLPRPLFEDGEPVQFEDEVVGCNGLVDRITICNDGSGSVAGSGDCCVIFGAAHEDDRFSNIKRHEILDADGVPIRVGDTVWGAETGLKYVVDALRSNIPGDLHDTMVRIEDGAICRAMSNLFTHKEPDSLEKLRDDMMSAVQARGSEKAITLQFADRLTAIMERDA